MDFDHIIDFNHNDEDDELFGEKMEEFVEGAPCNLTTNLGAKVPNVPKSLENCDFRLKF